MTCKDCDNNCRQGRDCPNRKVYSMKETWKRWGIAFIIGATIGLIVEQAIFMSMIKKDCEILGAFRVGDTPYQCRPSFK